jgi:hypothetical protein
MTAGSAEVTLYPYRLSIEARGLDLGLTSEHRFAACQWRTPLVSVAGGRFCIAVAVTRRFADGRLAEDSAAIK